MNHQDLWTLKRYDPTLRREWDESVCRSRQGTFLFLRNYMDYEADRFTDHSLLCYHKGRLKALLPAIEKDGTLVSHGGLTYGGFLTNDEVGADDMLALFNSLIAYLLCQTSLRRIVYRPIPYIYSRYPADEDLYALWRMGFSLTERRISSVLPLGAPLPLSQLRSRGARKAQKNSLSVVSDSRFDLFWPILEETLRSRHGVDPVHSLDEMQMLANRFPRNIRLYRVRCNDGTTLGGTVLYVDRCVTHAQYIAASTEGRQCGALDLLFCDLIHHTSWGDVRWFDFGNSVEQGGRVLNSGLIFQKEGFGGRAVMYDTYELTINK